MAVSDLLNITPKGMLGTIEIEATLEENYTDELQITEHPVQAGASITDHSFKKPSSVVIRCGWSNSSYGALKGVITSLFSGGGIPSAEYVAGVYSQLIALQESLTPFSITTSLRDYHNMLITAINVTRDKTSANILMVTATCRQIRIANTQSTSLPPKENQASPEKTAAVENAGTQQLKSAIPAPGGSLPPDIWSAPPAASPSVLTPTADTFK